MDYWFLDSPKAPARSRRFLQAIHRAAVARGLHCGIGPGYRPCKALVTYGLGGADRYTVANDHMARGLPMLGFDLGYWDRNLRARKYRFTLDGFHPRQVMEGPRPDSARFDASGLQVSTIAVNPDAPVLLVGNAPKSIAIGARHWTAFKSRELRAALPKRKILYRPKPGRPVEAGVVHHKISTAPIAEELRRVSLVVCRHSNVAIDACLQGVPVVCDDGAAAAIYPADLADHQRQPGEALRREFLHRLAWWQWSEHEAELFWSWFLRTFPAYHYRRVSAPKGSVRYQRRVAR